MMASYLTFLKNKAIAFGSYPDENYAREVMQLFSIGLYRLNPDGTPALHILPAYMWVPMGIACVHAHCMRTVPRLHAGTPFCDATGEMVGTYTNDDIVT